MIGLRRLVCVVFGWLTAQVVRLNAALQGSGGSEPAGGTPAYPPSLSAVALLCAATGPEGRRVDDVAVVLASTQWTDIVETLGLTALHAGAMTADRDRASEFLRSLGLSLAREVGDVP